MPFWIWLAVCLAEFCFFAPPNVAGQLAPNRLARDDWPVFTLKAAQHWHLNLPGGQRFDASGLLLMPDGSLLTISDRGPTVYRIRFLVNTNAADLIPLPNCFTP